MSTPASFIPLEKLLAMTAEQATKFAVLTGGVESACEWLATATEELQRAESARHDFLAQLGIVIYSGPTEAQTEEPESLVEARSEEGAITEGSKPEPESLPAPVEPVPDETLTAAVEAVSAPVRPSGGVAVAVATAQWKAWGAHNGLVTLAGLAEEAGVNQATLSSRMRNLGIVPAEEADQSTFRPKLFRRADVADNRNYLLYGTRPAATATPPPPAPVAAGLRPDEGMQAAIEEGKTGYPGGFYLQARLGDPLDPAEFRPARTSREGTDEGWKAIERWARGGTGAWAGNPLGGAVSSDVRHNNRVSYAVSGREMEARGARTDGRSRNGKVAAE